MGIRLLACNRCTYLFLVSATLVDSVAHWDDRWLHLVPSLWDLHMFCLLRLILFRTCRYFTGLCSSNTWSRPFGTCICSTCWDQSFSELVVILPDYAPRTPGPVPLGLAYVLLVETNLFPNLSLVYRTMLFEYPSLLSRFCLVLE